MRAVPLFLVPASLILLAPGPRVRAADEKPPAREKVVLVIHGGAGFLTEKEMEDSRLEDGKPLTRRHYEDGLAEALEAGYRVWRREKSTSVDAVEAAIRVMEDSELFNAGRGAVLNHDGRAELDAALME